MNRREPLHSLTRRHPGELHAIRSLCSSRHLTPLALALAVAVLLLAGTPAARANDANSFVFDDLTFQTTTIDFDHTFDGLPLSAPKVFQEAQPLRDQYASLGVHFGGANGFVGGVILHQDSHFGVNARSGTNFLAFNREADTQDQETPSEPLILTFDFPVPAVFLYVSGGFVSQTFRMDGYNRAGAVVDSQTVAAKEFMRLSVAAPDGITRVVVTRLTPQPHTTVTLPTVTGSPGGVVSIPIRVDGGAVNLASAQFTVTLPAVLTVADETKVAAGELLKNGMTQVNLSKPGVVEVTGVSGVATNGPGAVLTLTGSIPANAAPGTYPLQLTAAALGSLNGKPISADRVDGSLIISNTLCGDLDGNGKVAVTDAVIALRITVHLVTATPAQTQAACGNDINVSLAIKMLRVAVGLLDKITPPGGG